VEEGGETVFPNADRKTSGPEWSTCASQGLGVKTVRGDALLFYSLHPDGSTDTNSLHGSCPVIKVGAGGFSSSSSSSSSSLHFQLRPACGMHEYTSQAALEHTQALAAW
jgi:hypothetical protein